MGHSINVWRRWLLWLLSWQGHLRSCVTHCPALTGGVGCPAGLSYGFGLGWIEHRVANLSMISFERLAASLSWLRRICTDRLRTAPHVPNIVSSQTHVPTR